MVDVLLVTVVLAFFALAVGVVHLCDRVVGASDPTVVEPPSVQEAEAA